MFHSWLLGVWLASFVFTPYSTLIKAQSHYSVMTNVCERTSMYVVLHAKANSCLACQNLFGVCARIAYTCTLLIP